MPGGVQLELDAAIARTGLTEALQKAQRRIPTLLSLPPSFYEALERLSEEYPSVVPIEIDAATAFVYAGLVPEKEKY